MIEPFEKVLSELDDTFRRLEAQVPPPVMAKQANGVVWRYHEKLPQQALLQKLARYISGLRASYLLLENGYCQELGVMRRIMDEIDEDIAFITLGLIHGMTDRHNQYLEHFWLESPGPSPVKRDKIRAFVTDHTENPSEANAAGRTVFRTLSAYVHATSVAIVDMCEGDPPRFELAGMKDNPIYPDHVEDIWNSLFQGLLSAAFVAKAFNDEALLQERLEAKRTFEKNYADKVMP